MRQEAAVPKGRAMRFPVPILTALAVLAGCGDGGRPAPSDTQAATVRLAPVPGRPAAGYFSLRIEGQRGALVSVTSPKAGRIELHETMSHGNMSGMRPLDRVPVRDGETLAFVPGGRHLMIYELDRSVGNGGRMPLILHFERGAPVTLTAEVTFAGGDI